MRQLNAQQKAAIRNIATCHPDLICSEDIPEPILNKIVKMNEHETVYQNIDRYICALRTVV